MPKHRPLTRFRLRVGAYSYCSTKRRRRRRTRANNIRPAPSDQTTAVVKTSPIRPVSALYEQLCRSAKNRSCTMALLRPTFSSKIFSGKSSVVCLCPNINPLDQFISRILTRSVCCNVDTYIAVPTIFFHSKFFEPICFFLANIFFESSR